MKHDRTPSVAWCAAMIGMLAVGELLDLDFVVAVACVWAFGSMLAWLARWAFEQTAKAEQRRSDAAAEQFLQAQTGGLVEPDLSIETAEGPELLQPDGKWRPARRPLEAVAELPPLQVVRDEPRGLVDLTGASVPGLPESFVCVSYAGCDLVAIPVVTGDVLAIDDTWLHVHHQDGRPSHAYPWIEPDPPPAGATP